MLCWRNEHESVSHSVCLRLCFFPCLGFHSIGCFLGPWSSQFSCSTSPMRLTFIGSLSELVCHPSQGNPIRTLIPFSIPSLLVSISPYLHSSLASTWSFQTLSGLNCPFCDQNGSLASWVIVHLGRLMPHENYINRHINKIHGNFCKCFAGNKQNWRKDGVAWSSFWRVVQKDISKEVIIETKE